MLPYPTLLYPTLYYTTGECIIPQSTTLQQITSCTTLYYTISHRILLCYCALFCTIIYHSTQYTTLNYTTLYFKELPEWILTSDLLGLIHKNPLRSPTCKFSPAPVLEMILTLSLSHMSRDSCSELWDSITFHVADFSTLFFISWIVLDDNPGLLSQGWSVVSSFVIYPPVLCPILKTGFCSL